MSDMSEVIVPKVDQLTADHLLAGPKTITITRVDVRPGTEQPVTISYQGGDGLPWKPCKSMARVLVAMWGPDSSAYVGKSVTLFRDPSVTWGGLEVGGVRVSHMSHIDHVPPALRSMALTAKKGSKKAFRVQPMAAPVAAPTARLIVIKPAGGEYAAPDIGKWQEACERAIKAMPDAPALGKWRTDMAPHFMAAEHVDVGAVDHVQGVAQRRLDELADAMKEAGQ